MGNSSVLGFLRSVRDADLEKVLSWRNAPSVRRNMYSSEEISLHEHLAWWDRIKSRDDQAYLIYEREGLPQGVVAFNNISLPNKCSAWAFYASPDSERGTGSRMEFLALDYAFFELKLRKLYCEVLSFNQPVIELHKRFGFSTEGVFQEQYFRDETFHDIHRLAIFSQQWVQTREGQLKTLLQRISAQ